MSGGGRDDSYLGPSPPGWPPDCEGLRFTTALSSPQPDVVQQLSQDDIPASLTAADVMVDGERQFTAVSMYASWETPAGRARPFADVSAHRLFSDLAALVTSPSRHAIIAAGELNILHGYGEHGSAYWAARCHGP